MNMYKQLFIFTILYRITTDDNVDIQKFNILGYLEKWIQAAEWGALHMSATAACQGLTANGGKGTHSN